MRITKPARHSPLLAWGRLLALAVALAVVAASSVSAVGASAATAGDGLAVDAAAGEEAAVVALHAADRCAAQPPSTAVIGGTSCGAAAAVAAPAHSGVTLLQAVVEVPPAVPHPSTRLQRAGGAVELGEVLVVFDAAGAGAAASAHRVVILAREGESDENEREHRTHTHGAVLPPVQHTTPARKEIGPS